MSTARYIRRCAAVIGVLLAVVACKPGVPRQYIQPAEMEDLLVDYHQACALAQQAGDLDSDERNYRQALYIEAVLRQHGVTQAEFDSSLVYYYKRADRFVDVYRRVADRLEEQALVLGASETEIGKYASLNANGDTANVWNDRPTQLLLPQPPYHLWEFEVDADTLFKQGDRLLLQFMADFMFQDGTKNAQAFLCVDCTDTTVVRTMHFSASGLSQLNVDMKDVQQDIRRVRGFFYLAGAADATTTTRLLFLNNVQLIRFHTQPAEPQPDDEPTDDILTPAADSLQRDTLGGRLETDTLGSGDSTRRGTLVLPADTGAATHRVAPRLRLTQ